MKLTEFNCDNEHLCYINLDSIAVVRDCGYRHHGKIVPSGKSKIWMHGCDDPWEVDGTAVAIMCMVNDRRSRREAAP